LRQNIGSLDWRPGPGKVGNKNAKTPPLVTSLQENHKPKTDFFESGLADLLNPQRVWTPLWLQQLASYGQQSTGLYKGRCCH